VKVFLGLMLASFAMGILLRGRSERLQNALLLAGCALACGAYYFMNQI
jgi:hypothetical protein